MTKSFVKKALAFSYVSKPHIKNFCLPYSDLDIKKEKYNFKRDINKERKIF